MTIDFALRAIRDRTSRFPELASSHHFTFDRHLPDNTGSPEIAVIGLNPGLSKYEAKEQSVGHRKPCQEESSQHDFRRGDFPPNTKRWFDLIRKFCGAGNVTTSEFFFWSSKTAGQAFRNQFGCDISKSNHLNFCKDMNDVLFRSYPIRLVVSPGLGGIRIAKKRYDLELIRCIRCPVTNHRLVEQYRYGSRDWIFTKHWTGARGFSKAQRDVVEAEIQMALGTER
jgi:hypothetical protein